MRVSTAQFYFQNTQQITNKQSDVNQQSIYLSSGKRVLTAMDDAVAYGTLAGYKEDLASIEKYKRNINQAENRNSLQDVSFETAENVMQQLKQLFIQANNGTLSDSDLKSLAQLAENSQNELLDVANSKDETGGYIFAGYKIDVEPFILQPDGSVNYVGDNGVRELQIAKNVMVQTNQPGDDAFEKVPNAIGDFSASYSVNTSGVAVARAVIVDPGNYNSVSNPPDYQFVFSAPGNLTVTDSLANVVYPTTAYTPGQIIAFNGVEVQLSGNPLPGDTFSLTPQENISVFDSIKSAIDWMNIGSSSTNKVQRGVDYQETLEQLDQALTHLIGRRTDAGVRLKLTESQSSIHLDRELNLAQGQSNIEDLDFAKAVSDFEQSQVALQAAQQTFIQIKNLSLFNYL